MKSTLVPAPWRGNLADVPQSFPHFVRLDRDGRGAARHYVIHAHDPQFAVELMPDRDAPDKMGQGVIKRVCVPNSWAGDYGRYAKLLTQAQEFFAASGGGPAPKRLHG